MRLAFIFLITATLHLSAQELTADFSVKPVVCAGERTKVENLSIQSVRSEWDLCPGELTTTPAASIFQSEVVSPFKVELIEDDGQYYGFYTARGSNKLFRLDYGADVSNTPSIIDLGNLEISNGGSTGLLNIEIVKESNNYYGFILDYFNRLYRIEFGTSVNVQPTSAQLIYNGGLFSNPIDMVVPDGLDLKVLFVANFQGAAIVRLDFGTSFGASPSATLINVGFGLQGGLSFVKDQDDWYAMVSTFSGALIKLSFNEDIMDETPAISPVPGIPFTPSYRGVSIAFDGNTYFVFAQSPTRLYRISFGNSIDNNPIATTDLGGFGLFQDVWGFSMHKVKSDWLVYSSENTSANFIYQLAFSTSCFSDVSFSNEFEPLALASTVGDYEIILTSVNEIGKRVSVSKPISVTAQIAPQLILESQNNCIGTEVIFDSSNPSNDVTSYLWSFGDSQTSNLADATHEYTVAGNYIVELKVQGANGCENYAERRIAMYNPPLAAFALPSGVICTNNEFIFDNTTNDNFDGLLTYQWLVDGQPVGTDADLKYTFSTQGSKQVTLVTSIPGCSDENTQTIPQVFSGPTVDFSFEDVCEDLEVDFSNQTSGTVSNYSWQFSDGSSSSSANTSKTFTEPGTFPVTLSATNAAGCNNSKTKSINIHSKPIVAFDVSAAPLSCTGSPTPFTNNSTNMDGAIASWQWNFGDDNNNVSSLENPSHTYAVAKDYTVTLSATTEFGCNNTGQRLVTVAQSPSADFTHTLPCIDQPVAFTSIGSGIKTHFWEVGAVYYETPIANHTFRKSGSQNVQLTVVGNNECIAKSAKDIILPQQLFPEFSVSKNCVNTDAIFTDLTNGADPVVNQEWSFNGSNNVAGSPVNFSFSSQGQKAVKLTVTGASGCKYSTTKNIEIFPRPKAMFTATPSTGAAPLKVKFVNTSSGANSFVWKFDDKNVTTTETSPEYVFQNVGNYKAELSAINNVGCEDLSSTSISALVPVPDVALDLFTITENPDGTLKVIITLTNNGNTIIENIPVQLDLGGEVQLRENVTGPINPSAQFNVVLGYGISKNGLDFLCARTTLDNDVAPADNVLCTEFNSQFKVFSPYPNPATDNVQVEWVSPGAENVTIAFVDAMGKQIYNRSVLSTKGFNQQTFDVSQLKTGIFTIVVRTPQGIDAQRIFVNGR